jgi:hypothetical protein
MLNSSDAPNKIARFICLAISCWLLLALACATTKETYPQDKLPPYVRLLKSMRLNYTDEMKNTSIDLGQGEFVTIVASRNLSNFGRIVRSIGDDQRILFYSSHNGTTFQSIQRGLLQLGVIKGTGPVTKLYDYCDLVVIVWQTADYSKMAEFLVELYKLYPDHSGITEALAELAPLSEVQTAKAEAAKEIVATKEQIKELKIEKPQERYPAASYPDQRAEELERRLAELTSKLAQLDEVSRQLQEEREKAAKLSDELEIRQQRERELMVRLSAGAKIPPLLLITSPEDGQQNETNSVRLTGVVEDDRGLVRVEFLVNGRSDETGETRGIRLVESAPPKRMNFERRITLAPGANRIQVKATDTEGLTSERVLSVHYAGARRNVWAAIVGINDYPQLPKLKYAVNDAREFYRLMVEKNRVPAENIFLLLNDQASLKTLRSALGTKLKNAAGLDDMVIVFFAGHGATERDVMSTDGDGLEKYLLPWETDPSDLYSTAMPMREIAHIFGRIRSDRLIFIADSCYSGASGGRTISVTGTRANITDGFLERITGGRGKVIITASAANEVSVEKDDLQHGVFTYYLLEGLRGAADMDNDGTITVDEAYRYVSEKVPRATGQEQHPVKKGSVEGNLVLSIMR